MINKITFKNYKIFKKKQEFEFKPITILIGKNNSGKSSVLKLMTLLEGILKTNDLSDFNLINDSVIVANKFTDLLYVKFSTLKLEFFNIKNKEENILKLDYIIDNKNDKVILENSHVSIQYVDSTENNVISEFSFKTDFISGFREKSKKYYDYKPNKNTKSNIDGSNLYNFLMEDFLTTDKKYFNQISKWFSDKFEGWELHIDVDNEPYHIEIRKEKLEINISESGMGIGQSLPLVIRAFKPCEEETLIIIEEPESHLHPCAHAELAQLFADSIQTDSNKKYLFETHSLNFVLRMRRLVAEGKLNKNDLKIYYIDFNEETNESNLIEIKVDDGGKVNFWPEGVFNETLNETIAIRTAQIKKENVDRN